MHVFTQNRVFIASLQPELLNLLILVLVCKLFNFFKSWWGLGQNNSSQQGCIRWPVDRLFFKPEYFLGSSCSCYELCVFNQTFTNTQCYFFITVPTMHSILIHVLWHCHCPASAISKFDTSTVWYSRKLVSIYPICEILFLTDHTKKYWQSLARSIGL